MNKTLFKELWMDEGIQEVDDKIDDSWRHGNYHTTVFAYETPDEVQYWQAAYKVSGDGEYHGIRDNDFDIVRVYPKQVIIEKTVYKTVP